MSSNVVVSVKVFGSLRILPYVLHCERFVISWLFRFSESFACTVFK